MSAAPPEIGTAPTDQGPHPQRPPRMSEEFAGLIAHAEKGDVKLREIVEVTHGRAFTLLLILLSVPFCTPVPIPGLSTAFGLVIALIGFRLSLLQKPWLPAAILDRAPSDRWLLPVLHASKKLASAFEFLLRPRLLFISESRASHMACGMMISVSAVLLMLPLPVPFSNLFPAVTVILLAAGLLERDGVAILAGTWMFLLTLTFFGALAWGGKEMFDWVKANAGGWFTPVHD